MVATRNAKRSRSHATGTNRNNDSAAEILITSRDDEFSASTWWMVDIDSDDIAQGATPLVKRCMRVYNWDEEKSRKVLKAYRQFLFLKKIHKDWDAAILSPSHLVDQMWHQHILDVVNYCHDMMLLCGHVVGHNPDGAADVDGKRVRDAATREGLEEHFEGKYDKVIWGIENEGIVRSGHAPAEEHEPITIRIRDQAGEVTFFRVKKDTLMSNIFNCYATRKGVDLKNLRFLLDACNIIPNSTPKSLELEDHDLIDVILEQTGC